MAEPRPCGGCGTMMFPTYKRRAQKYCNHSCAIGVIQPGRFTTAETHAKRGDLQRGRGEKKGYVKRGGRHEHRVVMESRLGRKLLPDEIVHHKDENKQNNADGNLELTDRVEHGRIHNLGRKHPPKLTCKNGHAFTTDNTTFGSKGQRRCLICVRKYDREWKRARKLQLNEARP